MRTVYGVITKPECLLVYVGHTAKPLGKRLGQHLRDARYSDGQHRWLEWLRANQCELEIIPLESGEWSEDESHDREVETIEALTLAGVDLENTCHKPKTERRLTLDQLRAAIMLLETGV